MHDPFCYRREIWQAQHFPNSNHGLDTGFLRSGRRKRLGVLADHRFYVGLIHGTNTSPKFTVGANWLEDPDQRARPARRRCRLVRGGGRGTDAVRQAV